LKKQNESGFSSFNIEDSILSLPAAGRQPTTNLSPAISLAKALTRFTIMPSLWDCPRYFFNLCLVKFSDPPS
jgi:hypothetical protein